MADLAIHELEVLGEKFTLCNQRALFWEKESALVISDLHVGKTAHFRKHGIAIPSDSFQRDLQRLEFLLTYFKAEKLIINGDLLHAGDNSDVDEFCSWRNRFQNVEFHLIEGNHDRLSKNLEEKLCLTSRQEELTIGDFHFIHEFNPDISGFQITGHIHPGFVIRTKIKNYRLPCFAVTEQQLLLPAFSEFTGLDIWNVPDKATFFAITKRTIIETF